MYNSLYFRTLLDSRGKNILESQVWCNEKYFTDVSVLRLPGEVYFTCVVKSG